MPTSARTIHLVSRPNGLPQPSDFRIAAQDLPDPGEGEVLLQMLWLSLDPYMRGRLADGPSYAAPTALGDAPPCEAVARVLQSRAPGLAVGDLVVVHDFWRDHAVCRGAACRRLEPGPAPVQAALGVLGMPGLTAFAGLKHIGRPLAGETLVVGAASGAVGAVVGQIARLQGVRVVGVAGGPDKCGYVTGELGFDACIDRHAPDFAAGLAAACPQGVDVYFELTGGAVWRAVLPLLNQFARVPVCGTISTYNDTGPAAGPDMMPALMRTILVKSLTLRGFIVSEFAADAPAFHTQMALWLAKGQVRGREHVGQGLDSMVATFVDMLQGRNFGKTLIRLAE